MKNLNETTLQRTLMAQKNERENLVKFINSNAGYIWGVITKENKNVVDGKSKEDSVNLMESNTASIIDRMKSIIHKRNKVNEINNTTFITIADFFTGQSTEMTIAEVVILRDTFRETFKTLVATGERSMRNLDNSYNTEYQIWEGHRTDILSQGNGTAGISKESVEALIKDHDKRKPTLTKNSNFYESVVRYHEYLSQEIDIVLSEANSLTSFEL